MEKFKIFISYSRKDTKIFIEFKDYLEAYLTSINSDEVKYVVWTDNKINIGSQWEEVIQKQIEESKAAILLVSQFFFKSKFIKSNEFKKFLEKQKKENYTICPVLISECSFTQWKELESRQFFSPQGQDFGVDNFKYKIVPYDYIEKSHLKNTYFYNLVKSFESKILSNSSKITSIEDDVVDAYKLSRLAINTQNTSENNKKSAVDIVLEHKNDLSWLMAEAEKGNIDAMWGLGDYFRFYSSPIDYQHSFTWYEKAANNGNLYAMYLLGICHFNAQGTKQDYQKAYQSYKDAVDGGYKGALNNLGLCYNYGYGVDKDINRAFELYKESAKYGTIQSMYNLGNCYYYGDGTDKDMKKAFEWYEEAANNGHVNAINTVGNCYYHGDGVDQDENLAFMKYLEAANAGHVDAMNNLGWCHAEGKGVTKNISEANYWYKKARDNGYKGKEFYAFPEAKFPLSSSILDYVMCVIFGIFGGFILDFDTDMTFRSYTLFFFVLVCLYYFFYKSASNIIDNTKSFLAKKGYLIFKKTPSAWKLLLVGYIVFSVTAIHLSYDFRTIPYDIANNKLNKAEYAKAIYWYDKALKLFPNSSEILSDRGDSYRMLNLYEMALNDLNKAIILDPDSYWAYATRGAAFRSLGMYEEAIDDLNEAIRINSDKAFNKAVNDNVIIVQDSVIFLNHNATWAYKRLAETYMDMKQWDEAITNLTAVINVSPQDVWAFERRGESYRMLGLYDKAIVDLNDVIKINPYSSYGYAVRGSSFYYLEMYDSALTDFNEAIRLNPQYTFAYGNRGMVYQSIEMYDSALSDLNEAIRLDPQDAWAYGIRGSIYQSIRIIENAIQDFEQALKLDPTLDWVESELAELLEDE